MKAMPVYNQEEVASSSLKTDLVRLLGGSVVERLPSAQGVTRGSWSRISSRAPCREPASPSAWVSASLSGSLMNKSIKSKKNKVLFDSTSISKLIL